MEYTEAQQLPVIPMERHPLMKGKETDYFKKEKERHEIASELGLENQVTHSVLNVYQQDIEKLTDSKDYVEVSNNTLEKLFQFRKLKNMAIINNIKNILNSEVKWCFALLAITIVSWVGFTTVFPKEPTSAVTLVFSLIWIILNIGTSIGVIILPIFIGTELGFNFNIISVNLRKDSVKETKIKLPYGALLKLKEAKESAIFKYFIVASPDIRIERKTIKIPRLDPAILGITEDSKQFLICYWDIKGDFDRAEAEIERLKKLKIET